MQETWVRFLGQEDPMEKEMATHASILAWEIPWTEDPAGYSPWDCRVKTGKHTLLHIIIKEQMTAYENSQTDHSVQFSSVA